MNPREDDHSALPGGLAARCRRYVCDARTSARPHSNLGQFGEHALAFGLVGFAFAHAYPRHRLPAAAITTFMAGVLELLQLFVPGRHARLEDFIVDALATLAGFAVVSVWGFVGRLLASRQAAR
jgi:VanZ family protein